MAIADILTLMLGITLVYIIPLKLNELISDALRDYDVNYPEVEWPLYIPIVNIFALVVALILYLYLLIKNR